MRRDENKVAHELAQLAKFTLCRTCGRMAYELPDVYGASNYLKHTGFLKGEPEPLYRRDSLWISSYHIQNPFHLNITDITHVYNIICVYLLHNQKNCNTNLRVQALRV